MEFYWDWLGERTARDGEGAKGAGERLNEEEEEGQRGTEIHNQLLLPNRLSDSRAMVILYRHS